MVILGRLGAPHGIKGWVHVHSYTAPADNILNYSEWYLNEKEGWRVAKVLSIQPHGKHFIALLEGFKDRDQAVTLTNREFGVPREALPSLEEGEHYWADLVGMQVITEAGLVLGSVKEIFETGSNDVLVVEGETREHLIPYIPGEYVLEVDTESRVIRVLWDPEF